MLSSITMIAHCIFHQTPASERNRCEICGSELRVVNFLLYCMDCSDNRSEIRCEICDGTWKV